MVFVGVVDYFLILGLLFKFLGENCDNIRGDVSNSIGFVVCKKNVFFY